MENWLAALMEMEIENKNHSTKGQQCDFGFFLSFNSPEWQCTWSDFQIFYVFYSIFFFWYTKWLVNLANCKPGIKPRKLWKHTHRHKAKELNDMLICRIFLERKNTRFLFSKIFFLLCHHIFLNWKLVDSLVLERVR